MISGFFVPAMLPQPLVLMAVQVDEFGPGFATVPFVVDTGAAFTCIHAMDAIRYFGRTPAQLDPATWTGAETIGGVGGSLQYARSPANYVLKRDDGAMESVNGNILFSDMRSSRLPSLMGWDLLRLFRLEVHGPNQTVTLERL